MHLFMYVYIYEYIHTYIYIYIYIFFSTVGVTSSTDRFCLPWQSGKRPNRKFPPQLRRERPALSAAAASRTESRVNLDRKVPGATTLLQVEPGGPQGGPAAGAKGGRARRASHGLYESSLSLVSYLISVRRPRG